MWQHHASCPWHHVSARPWSMRTMMPRSALRPCQDRLPRLCPEPWIRNIASMRPLRFLHTTRLFLPVCHGVILRIWTEICPYIWQILRSADRKTGSIGVADIFRGKSNMRDWIAMTLIISKVQVILSMLMEIRFTSQNTGPRQAL